MTDYRRALFIQLRRIGDVLLCTPAVRAFKAAYPACKIDFLTEYPRVLWGNPHIEEVISVDPKRNFNFAYQFSLIRRVRAARHDVAIDFLGNPRSAWYALLSGAPTRLSYGYGHRRWAYNLVPPKLSTPSYAAIDKLNLLRPLGVGDNNPRLDFSITDEDRKNIGGYVGTDNAGPIITISPVSRREYKRWPLDRFAKLADMLVREFGATIIILAGPGEEWASDKMASMMKSRALIPRIGNLGELGAIFEKAFFHIGNDNGPKHIAVAVGAPTFTIFGPQDPISWTYPDYTRHSWISPDAYCDDCHIKKHRGDSNCIKLIPLEAVWKAVENAARSMLRAVAGQ